MKEPPVARLELDLPREGDEVAVPKDPVRLEAELGRLKDRGEEVDGRNIKFKATDFYMNLIAERIMARTIP